VPRPRTAGPPASGRCRWDPHDSGGCGSGSAGPRLTARFIPARKIGCNRQKLGPSRVARRLAIQCSSWAERSLPNWNSLTGLEAGLGGCARQRRPPTTDGSRRVCG
jgi:hypothetical protein